MVSEQAQSVIRRAKAFYESSLRDEYERQFPNRFLCIEPDSGKSFLGDTFDAAVNAALDEYPDRLTFTLQIGQPAALHLEVLEREGNR
ncbi:MAG: hypothetical protein Q8K78_10745 [Planctomycetaceae bacterium]|nr:hypothetical protein [Planctomycetaceae bacterium]